MDIGRTPITSHQEHVALAKQECEYFHNDGCSLSRS